MGLIKSYMRILCILNMHDEYHWYPFEGDCMRRTRCERPGCSEGCSAVVHDYSIPSDFQRYYLDDTSCEVLQVCHRCGETTYFGDVKHWWQDWGFDPDYPDRSRRICRHCGVQDHLSPEDATYDEGY